MHPQSGVCSSLGDEERERSPHTPRPLLKEREWPLCGYDRPEDNSEGERLERWS